MKKNTIPKHLLQPGMTLSDRRYRVDELMADNDLTVVYKGYDTFRKKEVAIRELFPKAILNRDVDHDYKVECKKLSDEELFCTMKDHTIRRAKQLIKLYPVEGIVNVLTYLEERETVYVIEEWVTGQSLKEKLWKRHSAKFLTEDLMQYLVPVMKTLSKLHGYGLFHGCVYPENILLTKDGKVLLSDSVNPMEDVSAPQLGDTAIRKDAYSPVDLYVTEAQKGPATDVYEVAAIFYHYVTGQPLPPYFERINEENSTSNPLDMETRVMKFQSEAIMKAASVYGFDRYEDMNEFLSALSPDDVNFEELNASLHDAHIASKEPVWYRHRKKQKRNYYLAMAGVLLLLILALGPGLTGAGKNVLVKHFYEKFLKADTAKRFMMVIDMNRMERNLYTNNYADLDEELTDEQKSDQARTKYYDYVTDRFVGTKDYNVSTDFYEYMKIDYRSDEVWVNYSSCYENVQTVISLTPNRDGKYEVRTTKVDDLGAGKTKVEYVNYSKKK